MGENFRGFLKEMEETKEGGFIRIHKEVDTRYEIAAIVTKLERSRKVPLLFFENVKGKNMPVVVNCYATRGRVARGFGVPKEDLSKRVNEAYMNPIPPVEVSSGPVQEVTLSGDDVDLQKIPAMIYHDTDAGHYITAGIIFAKDPDTGVYNLSYNRLMVKGKDRLGIFMTVGKHLNAIYSKLEERGKPLEVAVSIGNHPAVAIGALAIGPYEEDELGIIGGLKGSPLEMVKCKTVDAMVPAGAEIVLEGEIEPFTREQEGPFGEFSGYATRAGMNPVLSVKAITHRPDPIYQDICGGQHREHLVLATIPMEANYLRVIKGAVPEVEAVRVAAAFTLIISMRKKYEGQARTAMIAAFNADLYLKHVIVVDHDIRISDLQHVLWAIATRVQAERDIFIIPRARGSSLDPSAEPLGVVDKMGIDATAKPSLDQIAPISKVPKEVMERIKLEDYIEEDL
ncbi:MAG: UbiD family decarboxylase [Deltaproteobacteria bacterium]|nr:MAG: UbiD family decarboxylase [Deltaproteobacteria bacterium]